MTVFFAALTILLTLTLRASTHPLEHHHHHHHRGGDSDLIFVQLLIRHGDRAPDHFYANSPSRNSWPQGASQMTPLGIEQQYALGEFLRNRYTDFLQLSTTGVNYDDIYVRASDKERTVVAAQVNAASFFAPPPVDGDNNTQAQARAWNTNGSSDIGTLWSPVPVHTWHLDDDYFMEEAPCPSLDKLQKDFEKSDVVQEIVREQDVQNLLHQLSTATGEPFDKWTLTDTFEQVADTLACEQRHNITLLNVGADLYAQIQQLNQRVWALPYHDSDIASLEGGCLLGHVQNHMQDKMRNKTDGTYNSRKLVLFNTHDRVIMGVMSSAGLYSAMTAASSVVPPPFTATAIFELYGNATVKIFYKDSVASLDDIRTVEPRLLLQADLDDLVKEWKHTAIDEKNCPKACN